MAFKSIPTNFVTNHILKVIIEDAQTTIINNQFVKDNLVTYIIDTSENTLINLVGQVIFVPKQNVDQEDKQAVALGQDNLMQLNQVQPAVNLSKTEKRTTSKVKKSSNGFLKTRMATDKRGEQESYKSVTKVLDIVENVTEKQQSQADNDYISKLRDYKQRQRNDRISSPLGTLKHKVKLTKGQKVIFGYDGSIERGKQLRNDPFRQQVIETEIEKASKNNIIQAAHEEKSVVVTKLNERSVRNRTEEKGEIEFMGHERRQLIINSLKLSNSKTKMVFDGHNVTNLGEENESVQTLRKKNSIRDPLVKSIVLHQNANQKNTTQVEELQISLSVKASEQLRSRARFNTQISERPRKQQRINFESETFKKIMFTQVEETHFQLPKNRIRRAITNNVTYESSNDPDLLKIREKLNIKRSPDKLPQILSRYSNLQKDILREIRKKSKI